ncbi:type II toxin-antitoxin system VapC family toxin [Candidatus Electronema sp. JM]|uniref:type II toxin-antitoxin system VapC family toxin n=1 Tax=Candidatus Electronema sp. JM TaxID=3401571 RepID=UPI003AA89867
MKKIYIETSVVSYYVSDRSENIRIAGHQISTIEMWNRLSAFEVYISEAVIEESLKGDHRQSELRLEAIEDFNVLEVDNKSEELAVILLQKKAVPHNSPEDALHIAIAAVNEIDFILTWNFKHINNPFMRDKIRLTVESTGYKCPVICSPEELLGEDDE